MSEPTAVPVVTPEDREKAEATFQAICDTGAFTGLAVNWRSSKVLSVLALALAESRRGAEARADEMEAQYEHHALRAAEAEERVKVLEEALRMARAPLADDARSFSTHRALVHAIDAALGSFALASLPASGEPKPWEEVLPELKRDLRDSMRKARVKR